MSHESITRPAVDALDLAQLERFVPELAAVIDSRPPDIRRALLNVLERKTEAGEDPEVLSAWRAYADSVTMHLDFRRVLRGSVV